MPNLSAEAVAEWLTTRDPRNAPSLLSPATPMPEGAEPLLAQLGQALDAAQARDPQRLSRLLRDATVRERLSLLREKWAALAEAQGADRAEQLAGFRQTGRLEAPSDQARLVRRLRQPPPPHLQNSNLANPHRNFHPPRPKRRSPSLRASTSRLLFRLVPLPTKGSRPFPHPPKEHVGEIDAAKQIRSYRACTTGAY